MPNYRVQFFKKLLSSDGHCYNCLRRTIEIDNAANSNEAIRSAWDQYGRSVNGMARYRADLAEAEQMETA